MGKILAMPGQGYNWGFSKMKPGEKAKTLRWIIGRVFM